MSPGHLEMLIFLKANRELWSVKTMFELSCKSSDFETTTVAAAVSDAAAEENYVEDDED